MKRILSITIIGIALPLTLNAKYICNNDVLKTPIIPFEPAQNLNFTNWADYMNPDIIPCFEKLSNTSIRQSFTSDDNMTRAKIMTGSSGFDVIEQGALYLPSEIKAGALMKLDKSKLANWKYINKAIYRKISEINDPGNNYAIVYSYGTTGIAYNVDEVAKALGKNTVPDDWKYLFDPTYLKKLSKCGISLLDEPEQVFGNYFHYAGINPNTTSKADYEQAALYLIKYVRPYIKYFDSNKYQFDFTAGNLCLVEGYSGDVVRAKERAKRINPTQKLRYILPKSGTNIWFDMLMIPKGAKNLDAAYAFLNYNMEPYVAAKNSNYLYQPNAVIDNKQYLSDIMADPNITPNDAAIGKMYVLGVQPPELQAFISRMWMNVKYGIAFTPKYYKPQGK
ncbi:MAG: extracellular solute-binding protein [Francisellaceae bacterium]